MSDSNNTTSDEVVRLMWAFKAYDRIVSDCLLSSSDGEELKPAIDIIAIDIQNRLEGILGSLNG